MSVTLLRSVNALEYEVVVVWTVVDADVVCWAEVGKTSVELF